MSERELSASSREAPQAWHFGLALVWRRRPNEKRRRQANSARRRPEKLRAICCDLPSLLARFSLVLLSQSSASGGSLFTKDRRERALLHRSSLWLFFLSRRRGHWGAGALRNEAPPPKQQAIRSSARRRPFWGGAGRRPPCPNGALLEKNGWVARREEAAGASRWGLGSENRPARRCAENKGALRPGIFRSVSGPNSYGKPLHRQAAGQGGSMAAVETPFS